MENPTNRSELRRRATYLVLAVALLTACGDPATECLPLPCLYVPVAAANGPSSAPTSFEDCACLAEDGGLRVLEPHRSRLSFDPEGLAVILVEKQDQEPGWAYLREEGRSAWVLPFDNGPDYFVEGLARTVRDGKVGFINEALEVVVEAKWDFAFPFEGGLAIVCRGCRRQPVSPEDEHSEVIGGRWGIIRSDGRMAVPVAFDRDELPNPSSLGGTTNSPE